MSILTRYLLRAHLGPFLFALGTLTGLLLVNTVARRFEELAGKGLDLEVIGEVFLLSLPHIVALTLPMAVLVGVLYTFSQLTADNEINALKSSGVNLVRMLLPLIGAAAVLAVIMVWFNDRVLPETNHRLKNLLLDIGRQAPLIQVKEQVINEIAAAEDSRTLYYLYASRIDAATNRLYDVIIYDMSVDGKARTVYADSGRMAFSPNRVDLYLVLQSGKIHEVEFEKPETFHRLFFEEQRLKIAGVGTEFERSTEAGFRSDREMSLAALAAEVNGGRQKIVEAAQAIADRTTEALRQALTWEADRPGREWSARSGGGAPAASFATVPGGLAGGAAAPGGSPLALAASPASPAAMQIPSGGGSAPAATARPIDDTMTRRAAAEIRGLRDEADMYRLRVNQFRVEYHKKYAIPVACIVFVMIGAPLAIRFPRGGAGMVIAISLTIFSLYYAGLIGGEKLGDRGVISPMWGMWAPNVVLFIFGVWGMARMSRTSTTTRGGGWQDLLTSLQGLLARPFELATRRGSR